MIDLKANFVKRKNKELLEGIVLAYTIDEEDGKYSAIIAAQDFISFIRIYSKHLECTGVTSSKLDALLDAVNMIGPIKSQKEIHLALIKLDSIDTLKEKYDCDIIEVTAENPPSVLANEFIFIKNKILIGVIDDYFRTYNKNAEQNLQSYDKSTREAWKKLFLERYECLVKQESGKAYDVIENELNIICKNSPVPENQIKSMCGFARREPNRRVKEKGLELYKDLIFALEAQEYEKAAKIRDLLKKY